MRDILFYITHVQFFVSKFYLYWLDRVACIVVDHNLYNWKRVLIFKRVIFYSLVHPMEKTFNINLSINLKRKYVYKSIVVNN